MSEWNQRNPFIPRDESHDRLLSKRNLTAAIHFLVDHIHQDAIPALSDHYRPPGEVTSIHIDGPTMTVDDVPVLEALGERPELTIVPRLPVVDSVTGGIRIDPPGWDTSNLAQGIPGVNPEYITMEQRRQIAWEAQDEADKRTYLIRPDWLPPDDAA